MNLAPRAVFFRGGIPLALAIPPVAEWPTWVLIAILCAALCAIGYMTRWWPEKAWPTRAWAAAFLATVIALSVHYPIFRWIVIIECVFVAVWWWLLSGRDRDDD